MPEQAKRSTATVPIESIVKSKIFTRSMAGEAEKEEFEELTRSVKRTRGAIQNPLVRPLKGGRYEIIAGYRRWQAAKKAKLKEIRVDIEPMDDQEAALRMLAENVIRGNLNAIDEAELYWEAARQLHRPAEGRGGSPPHPLSAREAAALLAPHIGKSEDTIRKILGALPANPKLRDRLRQIGATTEHIRLARALCRRTGLDPDQVTILTSEGKANINAEPAWVAWAEKAVSEGWSTRDLRDLREKHAVLGKELKARTHEEALRYAERMGYRAGVLHTCPHCSKTWVGPCTPKTNGKATEGKVEVDSDLFEREARAAVAEMKRKRKQRAAGTG